MVRNNAAGNQAGKRRWYRYLLWGDYILYVVIVIAAVALFSGARLPGQSEAAAAVITMDGEVVKQIPLAELQGSGEFELEAYDYHYHFSYEDGRIRFAGADCPDQICVRTGWISRPGEIAACVPGHLILRIEGAEDPGQTDDVDVIIR